MDIGKRPILTCHPLFRQQAINKIKIQLIFTIC